jgi:iron-sulfur cluster assembly protein
LRSKVNLKDLRIILDHKSLMTLIGTEIDFVKDEIREEFVFKNSKAKGSCGCGSSFNF